MPSPDSKPSPKKAKQTPGVRGPGGPPPPPKPGAGTGKSTPAPARRGTQQPMPMPKTPASPLRKRFEDISLPIVERLQRLPKFVIIITPGVLLFLGLIQTGKLAWLGGILLVIVAGLLAWLTALSWPVVSVLSRVVRVVVILVVLGFATMKFVGSF